MKKLVSILCFTLSLAACSATSSVPDEPLQDRYWRAVEIDGQAVQVTNNRAEPHVVLAKDQRAHGSDGCNRFNGGYDATQGLRFSRMASTMMACIPPVDVMARAFSTALTETANYRIRGKQMELLDADGKVRMRLEATFLK
ncbi:MAG: META domain-containing protein [Azonexus sp.]|nr:META domain-containing protein [Azonexus sp.]